RNIYERNTVGIALMLVIDVVLFGAVGLTIWAVQMAWIPFWAAGVVNGVGHFWGYRNYDCADAATNLVPWGILIGGEELHNNHHSFATSAKLSARWYEFDIGWMYIRILEILGLAKAKKVIPTPRFCEARKTPDLDMLQAIITHRYDVMTRYMTSVKQLYREEMGKLKGAGINPRKLRRLVLSSKEGLPAEDRAQLESALSHSTRLATLVTMRAELTALWARSSASSEQLLGQLQDWVHRAEQSGIEQLQEFSRRLHRYA
ncbi:MAG: transposase, partial [Ottowia sp.]|nr:transposase [Ottowia sp.]